MKANGVSTRLAAATILTAFSTPAWAQAQSNNAANDATGGSPDLQQTANEIVVTALRRASSGQNVAATVEVVSAKELASSGINTIEQLGNIAPGVIIQRPPNNTANATIRGIGTAAGPVSFDQGVALFIDGVFAARGADFLSSLFDIERIEVVKGTQATVLGKNTSLGAIVLTTRKPGRDFAVDALGSYEFEHDSKVLSGGIDIPLGEDFAVRVAGQYQDLGGYLTNQLVLAPAEREARTTDERAGRVTLSWRPAGPLDATLSYGHEFLHNEGLPYEFIKISPAAQNLFNLSGYGNLLEGNQDFRYATYNTNGPTRLTQKADRVTGAVHYDFGSSTLTSTTGWSKFDQRRYTDYDFTPGSYLDDNAHITGKQLSEELQLTSNGSKAFGYIFGALYVHNKLFQNLVQDAHYPTGLSGAYDGTFDQTTDTWSGFGQLTYNITSQLTLTGGARLTTEKKQVVMERLLLRAGPYTTALYPPYPRTRLSRDETVVDGSASIQYHVTPRAMLYVSYGQGTKGGGFTDFAVPANAEYEKEVARTAEAGFKLEGPGGGWRLNVAGFRTDVDNFQNNFYNGSVFVVQNLDVRSTGAELEATWRPMQGLEFAAQGTYARAKNKDALPGIGDRLPRSPRLAGKAGFDYNGGLTNALGLHVGADVTHRSAISHQTDPAAVPLGPTFTTLNGIIGIADRRRGVELSLIGRNLNNARSLSFAFPGSSMPGSVIAQPEEGRTIALQLRFNM